MEAEQHSSLGFVMENVKSDGFWFLTQVAQHIGSSATSAHGSTTNEPSMKHLCQILTHPRGSRTNS